MVKLILTAVVVLLSGLVGAAVGEWIGSLRPSGDSSRWRRLMAGVAAAGALGYAVVADLPAHIGDSPNESLPASTPRPTASAAATTSRQPATSESPATSEAPAKLIPAPVPTRSSARQTPPSGATPPAVTGTPSVGVTTTATGVRGNTPYLALRSLTCDRNSGGTYVNAAYTVDVGGNGSEVAYVTLTVGQYTTSDHFTLPDLPDATTGGAYNAPAPAGPVRCVVTIKSDYGGGSMDAYSS